MKTFSKNIKKTSLVLLIGVIALLLSSCASTKSNYTTSDGIYVSETRSEIPSENNNDTNKDKSSYYKEYFRSKELTFKDVLKDDNKSAIFTDIDAYKTVETTDEDGNIIIEEKTYDDEYGYGAWGNNTETVDINIYTGGWNNWGWGNPYWGFGWNNWGWGNPYWGFGWNNWGWNNWGFFNPWIYNGWCGGWYGGWHNWGWNAPLHYNNGFAFHRGRRNASFYGNRTAYRSNTRGRTTASRGNYRGNYSRNESVRRGNRGTFSRDNSRINRGRSSNGTVNRGRPSNTTVNRGRPGSSNRGNRINRNHSRSRSGSFRGGSRSGSFRGGASRGGGFRGGGSRGGGRGRH